jgi:membrane-bound lytic murein transglycosylase F
MIKNLIFVFFVICTIGFISCKSEDRSADNEAVVLKVKKKKSHLDLIQSRGKIIALTDFNSHGYFIYRGTPMGFQYELLSSFAQHMELELEINVENEIPKAFKKLKKNKCDILAMDLAITHERKNRVLFTDPIYKSRQVLVQRLPENWRKMRTWDQIESHLIRDALDLQGKTVYISKGSVFYNRLININLETGGEMEIIEVSQNVDELIKQVAEGVIEYTICDDHVGSINKKYHRNIDIETTLGSYSQNLAWALPLESDSLLKEINIWLKKYKKSKEFYYVYNKYFKNSRTTKIAKSDYFSYSGGKISPYDELIQKYAERINWDWRLLASLIYQESKFNPNAKAWSGAFGIMQMMPETASQYEVYDTSSVQRQIEAGVKYIMQIDRQLESRVADSIERRKFVIASYNVGLAHVLDAQRLAKKYEKDPEKWEDNVDYFLLNKSKPKYYTDSVVYYGYCRGSEPYNYVNDIYDRYQHYINLINNRLDAIYDTIM